MAIISREELFNRLQTSTPWNVPVTILRQEPLPTTSTDIFQSLEEAQSYAANGASAYPGQIIAVVASDGSNSYYGITQNGTLEEIGTGGSSTLVVNNLSDLTTTVAGDLEVGQTAFVVSESKSYILTAIGDTPPSTYEWTEMTSSDTVWSGTENSVIFYALTQEAYDGIASKDTNTLYFITDSGSIYKGSTDVTTSVLPVSTIPTSVSDAVLNKLYINTTTFEAKITTNGTSWVDLSPGYVTTGSEWSSTANSTKLATIAVIKATITDALATIDLSTKMDTYGSGAASELLTSDAAGTTVNRSGISILTDPEGTSTLGTSNTQVPVASIIARTLTNKVDKVIGTTGDVVVFGADGAISDSSTTIGGATLSESPSATVLATEAAVAAAISWKVLS